MTEAYLLIDVAKNSNLYRRTRLRPANLQNTLVFERKRRVAYWKHSKTKTERIIIIVSVSTFFRRSVLVFSVSGRGGVTTLNSFN